MIRADGRRGRALWLVLGCMLLLAGCATATTPSSPIAVGPNVDVSQASGSQDEVSAVVDPADPHILLAGSNSLQLDPSVRVYSSTDGGGTWTSDLLPLPHTVTAPGAVDQWAAIGPDHRQAMSFLAFGQTPRQQVGSEFGGEEVWVDTRSGPDAAWQTASHPVFPLAKPEDFDDKPALVADNGSVSPYRGRLYVAWTRQVVSGGMLLFSASADWGQTWSAPIVLRRQPPNWGAALAIAPDGTLTVAWAGASSLWIARSTDGGVHFAAPAAFGSCSPPMASCVLGASVAAQADAGVRANPVLVELPASGAQGVRSAQVLAIYTSGGADGSNTGIYLARFDAASGQPLGAPAAIALGKTGTDQFLPAATYDVSSHNLWVCAYVSLIPIATRTRYTCTASRDGGGTFLAPIAVATAVSDETQLNAFRGFIGTQYGDYTALVAANGVAHVFWTDSRDLSSASEEIFTCTVALRGG